MRDLQDETEQETAKVNDTLCTVIDKMLTKKMGQTLTFSTPLELYEKKLEKLEVKIEKQFDQEKLKIEIINELKRWFNGEAKV